MNNQNIILFKFNNLYQILKELEFDLNLKVFEISDEITLKKKLVELNSSLVLTKKEINFNCNQFVFNEYPIKILSLIEKLNIYSLRSQYNKKSQISIGKYLINLNSREIIFSNKVLKLTEKEINILIFLSKTKQSIGINKLQLNVWGYQSKLETHTVETHIYRLRKKIYNTFQDNSFILSDNNGYKIN
tara:strand:- start:2492 stop:3055 length:564 start_codon:yes stop_codon:yes gene_type:complete